MKGILWKTLTISIATCLLMMTFAGVVTAIECQRCHREEPFQQDFSRSVHGANGCTSCHQGITSLDRHMGGDEKPQLLSCAKCHGDVAARYNQSYHAVYQNMACQDCHRGIHAPSA